MRSSSLPYALYRSVAKSAQVAVQGVTQYLLALDLKRIFREVNRNDSDRLLRAATPLPCINLQLEAQISNKAIKNTL